MNFVPQQYLNLLASFLAWTCITVYSCFSGIWCAHPEKPPNILVNMNFTSTSIKVLTSLGSEICTTDTCNSVAKAMLKSMDNSTDPCDDFYQYACGNWIKTHPIPDNETDVGLFKQLQDEMKPRIQGMLASKKDSKFESEQKSKAFFTQCLDQDDIDKRGPRPLLDFLDDLIGGWPVISPNWSEEAFDLSSTLLKMFMYSYQPLLSVSLDADATSPKDNVITLEEPGTFTSIDVLLSEAGKTYTDSYRTYLFNVTSLLKHDVNDIRSIDHIAEELEEIIKFEQKLAMAGETAVESRDLSRLKRKYTFDEIHRIFFNRSTLAKNLMNYTKSIFANVNLTNYVNETTLVSVRSPKFLQNIGVILEELERSPGSKRLLANYFGWKLIAPSLPYLPKRYRDASEEHSQRVSGQAVIKDKSAAERCAEDAITIFPLAIGAMYVRDFVPSDLKPKASMIVMDLREGFKELLAEAVWMDNVTYTKALEKLDQMLDFIAYPDILVDNITLIDEDYHEIEIGSYYFDTLNKVSFGQKLKDLKKLAKKNSRLSPIDDQFDITTVNAYNYLGKNLVVVLAAILRTPFFEAKAPFYLNYGGMGFVLGHELTHGFDDQGALFDDQGMMRSWWTNETTKTYEEKKQGLVEQYNKFSLPTGKVNGELTLGENIADNGGLKSAFRAYLRFRSRLTHSEPLLPGMETFSTEKLFFLSAAQIWCSSIRPKTEMVRLLTNEHSPEKFRVIGPMSNMKEFANAFQCPVGSTMNPTKKYAVW